MRSITCDETLIRELASPGSDQRCGVNLLCRPTPELIGSIGLVQTRLRARDPQQYYYPSSDLHLTVSEIAYNLEPHQAAQIGQAIELKIESFLVDLPEFKLTSLGIVSDHQGCALSFMPADRHLADARAALQERTLAS